MNNIILGTFLFESNTNLCAQTEICISLWTYHSCLVLQSSFCPYPKLKHDKKSHQMLGNTLENVIFWSLLEIKFLFIQMN